MLPVDDFERCVIFAAAIRVFIEVNVEMIYAAQPPGARYSKFHEALRFEEVLCRQRICNLLILDEALCLISMMQFIWR